MADIRKVGDMVGLTFCALIMAGCAMLGGERPKPITVPEIVQWSQDGMSAGDIIMKLRDSGTIYRLKASELAELKNQGVAPEVIDYMQETYLDAARRDALRRHGAFYDHNGYGGAPFGLPRERIYIIQKR